MKGDEEYSPHDGRPTTLQHPRADILGAIDNGSDRLLDRLIEVHGKPRPDIARELSQLHKR